MKRLLGSLVITAALIAGCASHRIGDIEYWKVSQTDPVMTTGHGALFDAQGKEVIPSPEFAIDAQRYYLKRLFLAANREQKEQFKAMQQRMKEVPAHTRIEQILVNSALTDWLIQKVQPQDRSLLASKNSALLNRFIEFKDGQLSSKDAAAGVLRKELLDLLRRQGLLTFLSTSAKGPEYIEECRKAGVPIPPDWGSPEWKFLGPLGTKFISSNIAADLFAFESLAPRGVCFALPRSSGDTITLLGIICLGTDTSKSCYWDNQKNKVQDPYSQEHTQAALRIRRGRRPLWRHRW